MLIFVYRPALAGASPGVRPLQFLQLPISKTDQSLVILSVEAYEVISPEHIHRGLGSTPLCYFDKMKKVAFPDALCLRESGVTHRRRCVVRLSAIGFTSSVFRPPLKPLPCPSFLSISGIGALAETASFRPKWLLERAL